MKAFVEDPPPSLFVKRRIVLEFELAVDLAACRGMVEGVLTSSLGRDAVSVAEALREPLNALLTEHGLELCD